jgi:hypothetical protein
MALAPAERDEDVWAAVAVRVGTPGFKVPPAVNPADDSTEVTEDNKLDRPDGVLGGVVNVVVEGPMLGDV